MKHLIGGFVLFAGLFPWSACQAQSLFGNSGALGSTSTSSGSSSSSGSRSGTSSSSASSGSSGLFSSGSTGTGSGSSSGSGGSSSGSGSGSANGATSTLTQSSLNMGDGSLGSTIGTSGFVGRGDNTARFLGNQNASNPMSGGTTPQFSQLQSLLGNNAFDPNATAATQTLRIRPVLKLGFQMPSIPSSTLQSTVQTRLVSLPNLGPRAAGVTALADENGQVTLSGLVQSEDDRRLMETLVRMEPGVRSVRNDLTVSANPATP